MLAVSTTMSFNLPSTVALVRAVRARFASLPVVLGGSAVRGLRTLADELGVDTDDGGGSALLERYAR